MPEDVHPADTWRKSVQARASSCTRALKTLLVSDRQIHHKINRYMALTYWYIYCQGNKTGGFFLSVRAESDTKPETRNGRWSLGLDYFILLIFRRWPPVFIEELLPCRIIIQYIGGYGKLHIGLRLVAGLERDAVSELSHDVVKYRRYFPGFEYSGGWTVV